MGNQSPFRTSQVVAMALAVGLVAGGIIYWKSGGDANPNVSEISIEWLQSGGVAAVAAGIPEVKSTPREFVSSEKEIVARKPGQEIVSLRTANAEVFKGSKPDELKAKVYPNPINYLDKTDSTYKPIDTSVHQISDAAKENPTKQFDEYVNAGVYKATWFADKPWDYKMYAGNSWIQFKAIFEESASLSIKTEALKTGIKETITLKDTAAPTTLQWQVTKSGSGITTQSPTATDANKKEVKVVSSQVGDTLTYEVDTTGAIFPILVDPTSVIATNDGRIFIGNADYATARDASVGGGWQTTQIDLGQNKPGNYFVYRAFFSFAIPDMAAVTSASLFLYGSSNGSTTDFDIYLLTSTYSTPGVAEDFDLFDGHQASGAYNGTILNSTPYWNSSSYSATWNEIVFNATGLSTILAAKNTTWKMAAISSRDYANTTPTGAEYISTYTSSTAGKEPYLSITYTAPAAPTVTTQSASSVATTTATLNGNITDTGGATPTVRGFAWGMSSVLSGGGTATTAESGSFSTGAFTGSAIFSCNTSYYSRAYATNSGGTGFGAISAPFTTLACPAQMSVKGGLQVKGDLHVKVASGATSGVACNTGADCYSGNCYVDADGDRYAVASGTKICQANSALTGTDCNDANAAIYPNATGGSTCSLCNTDGSITTQTSAQDLFNECAGTACTATGNCSGTGYTCGGNVAADADTNNACGTVTCTDYLYGWSGSACKLYNSSTSHNGNCNGSGACYSAVTDSCTGAGSVSGSAACSSSGCLNSCPVGSLAVNYDTVAEVCFADGSQHNCNSGQVCWGSTGACQAVNDWTDTYACNGSVVSQILGQGWALPSCYGYCAGFPSATCCQSNQPGVPGAGHCYARLGTPYVYGVSGVWAKAMP